MENIWKKKRLKFCTFDENWFSRRPTNPKQKKTMPLQYSCLENPMDRGAWWATVLGAAKNRTRLKQLSIKQNSDTCYDMSEPWGQDAPWHTSDTKGQTREWSTYVRSLEEPSPRDRRQDGRARGWGGGGQWASDGAEVQCGKMAKVCEWTVLRAAQRYECS